MAKLIVLDASALIALASAKDLHHNWAVQMFRATAEFDLQMSAISLAEVLVHPSRVGEAEKFLKLIAGLNLEIAPVEESDSIKLARLRATTNLKMPDAIVLHQAIKLNGSIATTDKTLARVAKENALGVFRP